MQEGETVGRSMREKHEGEAGGRSSRKKQDGEAGGRSMRSEKKEREFRKEEAGGVKQEGEA